MSISDWLPQQKQCYPNQEFSDEQAVESCHPITGTWRRDSDYLKSRFWWGGGASQEAFQQIEGFGSNLTHATVLSFGPVQSFLGGGQRLRDWAVGSWLCHYLTATIIQYWQQQLGGIILLPLHQTVPLSQWLSGQQTVDPHRFWQASLPNIITGIHPNIEGVEQRLERVVQDEWHKLIINLEKAVVNNEHYKKVVNGQGWQVIKRDSQYTWSVYVNSEAFELETIGETIAFLHRKIDADKQGRKWQGGWWGGKTSPSDGRLSVWHPGLKSIDNGGHWGIPSQSLEQWWQQKAPKTGMFSESDRLNSIEMIKRLASYPDIIEDTLMRCWGNRPPDCPWNRFPDRSSAAAVWVVENPDITPEIWNGYLRQWRDQFLPLGKRRLEVNEWGFEGVDQPQNGAKENWIHPRVLERRNVRDRWQSQDCLAEKLEQWDQAIPPIWNCPIQWTVGWRGDGDQFSHWLSGKMYEDKKLPWQQWHPTPEMIEAHDLGINPQIAANQPRQLDLPHHLDLSLLFDHWTSLLYQLTEKVHCGKVIFAGGDDFLLLGPLTELVSLTNDLSYLWQGLDIGNLTTSTDTNGWVTSWVTSSKDGRDLRLNTIPVIFLLLTEVNAIAGVLFLRKSRTILPIPSAEMTFSLGIVIAQRRVSQSLWHRALEQAYKEAKNQGRNRVCLNVIFNSGQRLTWVCPWPAWHHLMALKPEDEGSTELNRWEKLLFYLENTQFSEHHPVEVSEALALLAQGLQIPLTSDLIEAIAIDFPKEADNWDWWRNWLSIRAFLARQERERLSWIQRVISSGEGQINES